MLPDFLAAKSRETNCRVWIGACNNKGYGVVTIDGGPQLAHRLAYVAVHGPIPDDLVIDHVCRVRNCINPAHLEAVTQAENNRRGRVAAALQVGDTCSNGHLIGEGGIYVRASGKTECRKCRGSEAHRTDRRRPTRQLRAERVSTRIDLAEAGSSSLSLLGACCLMLAFGLIVGYLAVSPLLTLNVSP